MLSKLKGNNKGFTIIEVMIVLAIAGLIILIVLLAVPALQRNGRNTAIKQDASSLAGAISEFRSNNDGAVPTTISATSVAGATGTQPVTVKLQGGTTVSASATPAVGTLGYVVGTSCANTASGSNARSVAIYYQVENGSGGGSTVKCLDS